MRESDSSKILAAGCYCSAAIVALPNMIVCMVVLVCTLGTGVVIAYPAYIIINWFARSLFLLGHRFLFLPAENPNNYIAFYFSRHPDRVALATSRLPENGPGFVLRLAWLTSKLVY